MVKTITIKVTILGLSPELKEQLCNNFVGAERRGEVAGATVYYRVEKEKECSIWWIIYNFSTKIDIKGLSAIYMRYSHGAIIVFRYTKAEIENLPKIVEEYWGVSGIKPIIFVGIQNQNNKFRELARAYIDTLAKMSDFEVKLIEIDKNMTPEKIKVVFDSLKKIILEKHNKVAQKVNTETIRISDSHRDLSAK